MSTSCDSGMFAVKLMLLEEQPTATNTTKVITKYFIFTSCYIFYTTFFLESQN